MTNPTIVPSERLLQEHDLDGRYRILTDLGSGAFGSVCVAEDMTTGAPVAIRLLPNAASPARGVDVLERISPTVLAASAAHPALVRVLDVGRTESGRAFVVTEFVDGRRLSDVLVSGPPLDVVRALAMALELGGAVETMHNMGLVHGGLSSRNVMVLADGAVKLTDVELANLREPRPIRPAGAGASAEAPAPAAPPEEIITEKSDIYSFASIVYEMLCGAPPFAALTTDAGPATHAAQRPVWPRHRRAKIPRSIRRMIDDALSETPRRRPFMSELLNGLVLKPSLTRSSRVRVAIVGASAVVSVALGLLGWTLVMPRQTSVNGPVYSARPAAPVVTPAPRVPTSFTARGTVPPTPVPPRVPARAAAAVSAPARTTPPSTLARASSSSRAGATAPRESAMPRRTSTPPHQESTPPHQASALQESSLPGSPHAIAAAATPQPTSTRDDGYDPAAVIDWVLAGSRR